jgi:hypothetical protein
MPEKMVWRYDPRTRRGYFDAPPAPAPQPSSFEARLRLRERFGDVLGALADGRGARVLREIESGVADGDQRDARPPLRLPAQELTPEVPEAASDSISQASKMYHRGTYLVRGPSPQEIDWTNMFRAGGRYESPDFVGRHEDAPDDPLDGSLAAVAHGGRRAFALRQRADALRLRELGAFPGTLPALDGLTLDRILHATAVRRRRLDAIDGALAGAQPQRLFHMGLGVLVLGALL